MGRDFSPESLEVPTTVGEVWAALQENIAYYEVGSLNGAFEALKGIVELHIPPEPPVEVTPRIIDMDDESRWGYGG